MVLCHLLNYWAQASASLNHGRFLWRLDRQEISKGKTAHLAAAVVKGKAPLVLPDATGAPNTAGSAVSISPNGIIAGRAGQGYGRDPLRWVPDITGTVYTAESLRPVSGAGASFVYGVNSDGVVVGTTLVRGGTFSKATLWDRSGVPFDLNELIHPDTAIPDVRLGAALEINDQGWIIGKASAGAFILTPVISVVATGDRSGRIEALLGYVRAAEPGTVLDSLAKLRSLGVGEEGQTSIQS